MVADIYALFANTMPPRFEGGISISFRARMHACVHNAATLVCVATDVRRDRVLCAGFATFCLAPGGAASCMYELSPPPPPAMTPPGRETFFCCLRQFVAMRGNLRQRQSSKGLCQASRPARKNAYCSLANSIALHI